MSNAIVTIESGASPKDHEKIVASILADFYQTEVTLLKERNGYKITTPDIYMLGNEWEIKGPTGRSRAHTIKEQFRTGLKQARRIIVYTKMTPLADDFILKKVKYELRVRKGIQRVIVIDKIHQVIEVR